MIKRNRKADLIKAIATLALIVVNFSFSGALGTFAKAMFRFALPFFFFIGGYNYLDKEGKIDKKRAYQKVLRALLALLKALLFYMIFYIFYQLVSKEMFASFISRFTAEKLIKLLVTNDPLFYSHLWYFLAQLYICILMALIVMASPGILHKKKVLFIASAVLALAYSFQAEFFAFDLFPLAYTFRNSDQMLIWYNLFIFRALPFFLAGLAMRQSEKKENDVLWLTFIVMGLWIAGVERLASNRECLAYLGTYLTLYGIARFIHNGEDIGKTELTYIGNRYSQDIYIYHIAIGKLLELVLKKLSIYNNIIVYNVRFIFVALLTLYFVKYMYKFEKRLREVRRKVMKSWKKV